jgi:hypothetical protein
VRPMFLAGLAPGALIRTSKPGHLERAGLGADDLAGVGGVPGGTWALAGPRRVRSAATLRHTPPHYLVVGSTPNHFM